MFFLYLQVPKQTTNQVTILPILTFSSITLPNAILLQRLLSFFSAIAYIFNITSCRLILNEKLGYKEVKLIGKRLLDRHRSCRNITPGTFLSGCHLLTVAGWCAVENMMLEYAVLLFLFIYFYFFFSSAVRAYITDLAVSVYVMDVRLIFCFCWNLHCILKDHPWN